MTFQDLIPHDKPFSSFKRGPAALPELSIKAFLVLLYNACPHARTLLLSLIQQLGAIVFLTGPGAEWEKAEGLESS